MNTEIEVLEALSPADLQTAVTEKQREGGRFLNGAVYPKVSVLTGGEMVTRTVVYVAYMIRDE